MAYEKLKDENYKNLGGINIKASEYMTGENQVLNLRNYTFDRPGAWKSRPGYTGFATLNAGGSYAPDSVFELVAQGSTGSFRSLGSDGETLTVTFAPGGTNLFIYSSGTTLYNNTSLYALASGLGSGSSGNGPVDFQVFNNKMYFANGYAFKKFDLFGSYPYSIPEGGDLTPYFTFAGNNMGATFASLFTPSGTLAAGTYIIKLAPARFQPQTNDYEIGSLNGASFVFSVPAATSGSWDIFLGTTIPFSTSIYNQYGISWMALYINGPGTGGLFVNQSLYLAIGPTWTSGLGDRRAGDLIMGSFAGATQWSYSGDVPKGGFVLGAEPETDQFFTLAPRYLETYNNMMFMAGFSTMPSIVYHTELGNPDIVEPEYFFEVRTTGNGDVVTCMKVFQDSLVIFKNGSTHELQGDSPDSLSLKDTNLEYGCLSNQAAVTFENKLWFMDRKGIAEYNGANTFIVSSPVENYLEECDKDTARGYHLKKYSQVWFIVKVTGQSYYRAFVYDYLINSLSIYDNFNVTGGSNLFTNTDNTKDVVFYGQNATLQSKFMRFGQSLTTDDGYGITYISKTKFHKRLGDTTQEMWRRFYLNNEVESSVIGVTINFYADYGASIVESRNISLGQFQTRIDFGISAKSLSVETIIRASESITINGYTIESRYLRSV